MLSDSRPDTPNSNQDAAPPATREERAGPPTARAERSAATHSGLAVAAGRAGAYRPSTRFRSGGPPRCFQRPHTPPVVFPMKLGVKRSTCSPKSRAHPSRLGLVSIVFKHPGGTQHDEQIFWLLFSGSAGTKRKCRTVVQVGSQCRTLIAKRAWDVREMVSLVRVHLGRSFLRVRLLTCDSGRDSVLGWMLSAY